MNPTRDPARVGIQSDPEHFSGSRVGILPLQEPPTQDPEALDPDLGWIPTRVSGISSTGNLFQQAAAGSHMRSDECAIYVLRISSTRSSAHGSSSEALGAPFADRLVIGSQQI
eukprot:SAG25_NODE_141_length_14084_cov_356.219148_8_plen_113_part_00